MCSYLTILCHIQIYTSISLPHRKQSNVKDKGKEEGFNYEKLYVIVVKWQVRGNHSYSSLLKDPTQAIRDLKEALQSTWFPSVGLHILLKCKPKASMKIYNLVTKLIVTHPRIEIRRSRDCMLYAQLTMKCIFSDSFYFYFYLWAEKYYKKIKLAK